MGDGAGVLRFLMKPIAQSLLCIAWAFIASSAAQPGEKAPVLAAWYGLLPPCQKHLHPMYDQPVIDKKKGVGSTYSQTARFDALTDLPRSFRVTLARDPDFKKRFGRDAMKDAPVTTLELGKRAAWVWTDNKKVVVPIGDDKAVLIDVDPYSQGMALVEYAKSLDYDRIEKALTKPPRTDFTPTLRTFDVFKKGDSSLGLYEWAGPASTLEQVGTKEDERFRWTYSLKDGSKVIVLTAGKQIESMTHEAADGKIIELQK